MVYFNLARPGKYNLLCTTNNTVHMKMDGWIDTEKEKRGLEI